MGWMDQGSNSGGGDISTPNQTGPGVNPAFYTMGTGSFPGVKQLGCGIDHPPPSSVDAKERVELYLYSPSGPLWPVLGWILPLHTHAWTGWGKLWKTPVHLASRLRIEHRTSCIKQVAKHSTNYSLQMCGILKSLFLLICRWVSDNWLWFSYLMVGYDVMRSFS